MNPLINIDVTVYFEISNSEMFGGKGTVGYTSASFGEVKNLEILEDAFVEDQKKIMADMLKVASEDVRLISKEAYELATKEDSDDIEFDYEEDDYENQ